MPKAVSPLLYVPIFKVTGAGNHFVLIDLLDPKARAQFKRFTRKTPRKKLVRQWCNPNFGIGADGLLFLEPARVADVAWDFYNGDGSKAEMCGNAARCVGLYLFKKDRKKLGAYTLKTRSGVVGTRIQKDGTVAVEMTTPKNIIWDLKLTNPAKDFRYLTYSTVDTGVPHAVIEVPKLNAKWANQGLVDLVRSEKRFRSDGVNVTFFTRRNKMRIESLTYERGVSGFTQACGTGAVAAALVARRGAFGPVDVKVPGGLLKVKIDDPPVLIGPARIVAKVEFL